MPDTLISLVVPVYNVARFLPAFLASLDAQTIDLSAVEIVFVDDGSTDDSAAIISQWLGSRVTKSRLIRQDNAGLAAARNRGLSEVTGSWVTFPDPDDCLSPQYFELILDFLRSKVAADVHLVAANLLRLNDETGRVSDQHPLRFKFADGRRIFDLERDPKHIHLQAASAFYRRASISSMQLQFDSRVRPNFEDAYFTALYLAHYDRPQLAAIPDAQYLYRERSDGTSLTQSSWRMTEKYTDLLQYGYLALLQQVKSSRGQVPLWVQTLIVYELAFFFRQNSQTNSPTAGISNETSERFHTLLRQIVAFIDVSVIEGFNIVPLKYEIRAALIIGAKGIEATPPNVQLDVLDRDRRLVRAWYYYKSERPSEVFRSRGLVISPVHQKVRAVQFMGQTMMYQRIAWLPVTGPLALELDGSSTPLTLGRAVRRRYLVGPRAMWRSILHERVPVDVSGDHPAAALELTPAAAQPSAAATTTTARISSEVTPDIGRSQWRRPLRQLADASLRRYARSMLARRRYRDAWLLIDRDDQAQDNAERLYSYLREHQPQVNAWFVLARDCSDWNRLSKAGFRLIKHRSWQHKIALINCRQLLSSQIDHYVVEPLPRARFGPRQWKYTFLQHGVTKDDLSVWINRKPIDLMITATPAEHESIVGDGTPYVYTTREVAMTGFPRHDRLLELADQTPVEARRTVLIAPTWRRELLLASVGGGNARGLMDGFWETEYAVAWRSFIESETLRTAAADHGWKIAFLPHPNMQNYLDTSPLSPHITSHRFKDVDVQSLLATSGILVTDYSSMGFEAAYIQRPVVYFQFDQESFFSGTHAYRRGNFWSYEENGFGPVATDCDLAAKEVASIIARGGTPDPLYAERMATTFPLRDGKCSERTYEAVCNLERRSDDAGLPLPLASD